MAVEPVVIPEKIYFKIGEVCELVGVQAHVLRYWETEFPTLSPQKNASGQRSYRRKDVETALRIKQLLYNEMFTIAGARKKIQSEQRDGTKPRSTPVPEVQKYSDPQAPTLFDTGSDAEHKSEESPNHQGRTSAALSTEQNAVLKTIAVQLLEIRELLKHPKT